MLYVLDKVFLVLVCVCAVLSVILTVHDKRVSKIPGHRRVRERTLLLLPLLGPALPEFLTMLLIRHKTRHKRFMLGLPAMMLLHLALAVATGLLWK